MKVIKFPEKKKWDGRGLKKSHFSQTEEAIYRDALRKAEERLEAAKRYVQTLERQVKDAKRQHYQAQEKANEQH